MASGSFFKNKKIIMPALFLTLLALLLVVVMMIPDKDNSEMHDYLFTDSSLYSDGNVDEYKSLGIEDIYKDALVGISSGESNVLSDYRSIIEINASVKDSVYTLTKSDDGVWTAGENVQISTSTVERLSLRLYSLDYADKINEKDADAASCGITGESDYVTFKNNNGVVITYTLGNAVAGTDLYYMTTSFSKDIYMIEKIEIDAMFQPLEYYRNDNLHQIEFENVTKIYLKNKNTEFSIEKTEIDHDKEIYYDWKMVSPYTVFARGDEVERILIAPGALLEAIEYVSDAGDFENYGIDKNTNMVIYEDAQGKGQTVYFSELIDNNYYVAVDDRPNIYCVSKDSLPFVDMNIIDIAERNLYLTGRDKLSEVIISGEGKDYTIKFEKTSEGESKIQVNGKYVESETDRSEIFMNLCSLYANDMTDKASGEKTLVILFKKTDGTNVILDFYPDGERYYNVSRNGVPLYSILKNRIITLFELLDLHC